MRATLAEAPVAGGEVVMNLEIWDADDEPLDVVEAAAAVRAPGGRSAAVVVPGVEVGVFQLRYVAREAGTHEVSVFAPSGETTFTVRVEVGMRPAA
jgi:hypothetical protein